MAARASEKRVLHFASGKDWMDYNASYGSRDPFGSIVSHLQSMAGDIVTLREFSATPEAGFDYVEQLILQRARREGNEAMADKARGNADRAKRMFRMATGGVQSTSTSQAMWARFFSSVRHVLSSAMLDRAIISSVSDLNTMRLAASTIGLNPENVLSKHVSLMASRASREEAAQMGWIYETMADPGTTMARYQSEVPPAAIAERLSSGVMRAQGIAGWTDSARVAFQMVDAADMANQSGRAFAELDDILRGRLEMVNVTPDEWDAFRSAGLFESPTGGKFLPPIWWRETTDLPPRDADRIYLKIQSMLEDQTEGAVPTNSLFIRSNIEGEAPAGSPAYEVSKSLTMVKSFVMAFTANQVGRMMALPNNTARAIYAANLTAGATVLGAMSLQIYNLATGRELEDMTTPEAWGKATLKGGGFGVLADIVATGETSFGGGFAEWTLGPMFNAADDVWDYTFGNAIEAATGQETKMGRETVTLLDRYTPGADLPYIGLAVDRLMWDQLQGILDPEAQQAFRAKAARSERNGGAGFFAPPGSLSPSAPNLASIIGG